MMTGLSFVIGVFPMVFASGAGSANRQAIGQTTFWGMSVGMIAGIMLIPPLYALFEYLVDGVRKSLRKKSGNKRSGNYSRRFVKG